MVNLKSRFAQKLGNTPFCNAPVVYANNNGMQLKCSEPTEYIQDYLNSIHFPTGVITLSQNGRKSLPITNLPSRQENSVLGEYIERILSQSSVDIADINFLTHELVTNVKEHSECFDYWMLGQYYGSARRTCEIVIADCGKGYRASYMGTEFEVNSDADAIINAFEGRSSKKFDTAAYGIRSIADIFINKYKGKMVIMSGDSIVYYKPDRVKKVIPLNSYWQGSLIGINFSV